MYDKASYTPNLRAVCKLSRKEAKCRGFTVMEPEHYMLGILRNGKGLAVEALRNLRVNLGALYDEVNRHLDPIIVNKEDILQMLSQLVTSQPEIEIGPEAAAVLKCAKDVALELRHNWIGTEHLLLGFLRHQDNIPAKSLSRWNIDFPTARDQVLKVVHGTAS